MKKKVNYDDADAEKMTIKVLCGIGRRRRRKRRRKQKEKKKNKKEN